MTSTFLKADLLLQSLLYLFAPWRQPRVSSNLTLDVELAFSVATQVDGARRDVDVHEVVDDAALYVVQHSVDQVALAYIHDFDEGKIPKKKKRRRLA